MLQVRYPTTVFLALLLLSAGGQRGNFFERSGYSAEPAPIITEFDDPEVPPPDKPLPANPPVVVEVRAAYHVASAEEVERQVTIPLEVTLGGLPVSRPCAARPLPA